MVRTDGLFDVQSTDRAWRKAVEQESWDSVAAFFEAGVAGSTKLFSVPSGLKLFQYAIRNENEAILVAFMGDRLHTPGESPDPHLGKVWKQIQTRFYRFETIERYSQETLVNKDFHFEEFLIANKCRLQSLCTIGGYHPKLGWQEMVQKGYIETQSESGLVQVVEAGFGQESESEMLSGIFLNPEVEEQIERLGSFREWPRSIPQSTIPVRFPTEVIPTICFKEFPHPSVQTATSSPATWDVADTIVSRLFKLEDACLMAPSIHEYVEFQLDPGFLEVVSVDFGNHACSQFQSGQVQVSLLAFEAAVRPATFDQALCDQAIGVALAGGFSVAQLPVGYHDSQSGQLFYVDPHSYRYPFRRQYMLEYERCSSR
ncbi:hypothetical protein SLS58_007398 [Diplodia intermedia]|uniref:Uncharacterized protein n=1 Tax=Diplodia intermedia TaxID=856260 RepID=A0ABR3TK97_9PEZI